MRGQAYFDDDNRLRSDIGKRAVRGAGATLFSQAATYGSQMVGTIILARLLTPNDFGLVTMVGTFSLLFQNCGMRGFTEAILQDNELTREKVSTIFWIHLLLSLLLALLFALLAPVIVWFYDEPKLGPLCYAITISFVLSALSAQHLALLQRSMQYYRVAATEISSAVVSTLAAIALALSGWGYWALLVRRVAQPLVGAASAWALCGWLPGLPVRVAGLGLTIRFSASTYGYFAMNYFSRNIDKVLVGWKHGSNALGFYEKAYYLFVMPVNQSAYPLTSVAVSGLSRLREDATTYTRYYLKSLAILAFVGMPMGAILTVAGKDIILVLLGVQWEKTGEIFAVFGPGVGVLLVYGTHGWLHLSLGRADRWLRWGFCEMAVTTLFFIAGLRFGGFGVAAAYTLSVYVLFGPGLWYAGRPIELGLRPILGAIWRYYAAAAASGGLSWLVLYRHDAISARFLQLNALVRVVAASLLCAVLYLAIVVVIHGGLSPLRQFLGILRDMVPARRP